MTVRKFDTDFYGYITGGLFSEVLQTEQSIVRNEE